MRFLVDAQLPPALARFLEAQGHEVAPHQSEDQRQPDQANGPAQLPAHHEPQHPGGGDCRDGEDDDSHANMGSLGL